MKFILYFICGLILLVATAGSILFFTSIASIPRLPDDLRLLAASPATEVYARDGELLAAMGGRQYVSLDRISPHFLDAVIATEDRRFREHHGIDRIATVRALWQNVVALGNAPGGSTITQQLAKNLFFTFGRSWKRKVVEAMAAVAIEEKFGKDKILETYCNFIDFGQYAYGIEKAAQTYFGKHASELELHEAALLAGVPNAPSRLNPYSNLEAARKRQRTVLRSMARAGMIDASEVDSISAIELKIVHGRRSLRHGSYPVDRAVEIVRDRVGSAAVSYGGIRVYTSIDTRLQKAAQQALTNGIEQLRQRLKGLDENAATRLEGALVAIDVGSGEIVAMVGGHNYSETPYNRAVHSLRQPGSSFKPLVYLTALESGKVNPATVLKDTAVVLNIDKKRTWKPQNFSNSFRGDVTLKLALMKSINTISAQLIEMVGPDAVVKTANRIGISTPVQPHLSLALGSEVVTVLDMANAYSTIARMGKVMTPHIVKRVEGNNGELLMEVLTAAESRFAPETIYQLVEMMQWVIEDGTGTVVRRRGFKGTAIGKTGTPNDYTDAWFVGGTPYLITAVWVGYDDNRTMRFENNNRGVTGASGAAPIWADFMIKATEGTAVSPFPRPTGIEKLYVEPNRGLVSHDSIAGYLPVALTTDQALKLLEESRIAVKDTL